MPSVSGSPLQLRITGGTATFEPARLTAEPMRLRLVGGAASLGPGTGTITLTELELKLDRLQRQTGYFDTQGRPTAQMQILWQRHCEALEAFAARISAAVVDQGNLLAQILATNAIAQAANDNAMTVMSATSLANSYTNPTSVLTADSTGTITIAAHERRYGPEDAVSVNGGSLSGFAGGGFVTVYYEDAGREGGPVTYQGTTLAVAQEGATHIVGGVTIPEAGDPPSSGTSPTAPGYTPPPNVPGTDYQ